MKLKEYFNKTGVKQRKLAQVLGITDQSVGAWLSGKSKPNKKYYKKIFIFTDGRVSPNDFLL